MVGNLSVQVADLQRSLAAAESQASEAATLARAANQTANSVAGERDEAKILAGSPPLPDHELFGGNP